MPVTNLIGQTCDIVGGCDPNDRVNRAIEVPTRLYAADGRVFEVRDWNLSVPLEGSVEISPVLCVAMPRGVSE